MASLTRTICGNQASLGLCDCVGNIVMMLLIRFSKSRSQDIHRRRPVDDGMYIVDGPSTTEHTSSTGLPICYDQRYNGCSPLGPLALKLSV